MGWVIQLVAEGGEVFGELVGGGQAANWGGGGWRRGDPYKGWLCVVKAILYDIKFWEKR